jgi:Acyltransferase family
LEFCAGPCRTRPCQYGLSVPGLPNWPEIGSIYLNRHLAGSAIRSTPSTSGGGTTLGRVAVAGELMELRENADCETDFGRLMTASSRAASLAPARPRSVGADLLRALAILLVMLWHLPKPATPALLGALKPYGWIGVDLFFVLSGYLIGTQLLTPLVRGERVNLRAFFVRRSFRILPAFLVVLCVYVFVPVTRETSAMEPAWRFLTFTMNFGLNFAENGTFSHAWSLCVEEHFYLILPLLLL